MESITQGAHVQPPETTHEACIPKGLQHWLDVNTRGTPGDA
jgi:hypothetical protein